MGGAASAAKQQLNCVSLPCFAKKKNAGNSSSSSSASQDATSADLNGVASCTTEVQQDAIEVDAGPKVESQSLPGTANTEPTDHGPSTSEIVTPDNAQQEPGLQEARQIQFSTTQDAEDDPEDDDLMDVLREIRPQAASTTADGQHGDDASDQIPELQNTSITHNTQIRQGSTPVTRQEDTRLGQNNPNTSQEDVTTTTAVNSNALYAQEAEHFIIDEARPDTCHAGKLALGSLMPEQQAQNGTVELQSNSCGQPSQDLEGPPCSEQVVLDTKDASCLQQQMSSLQGQLGSMPEIHTDHTGSEAPLASDIHSCIQAEDEQHAWDVFGDEPSLPVTDQPIFQHEDDIDNEAGGTSHQIEEQLCKSSDQLEQHESLGSHGKSLLPVQELGTPHSPDQSCSQENSVDQSHDNTQNTCSPPQAPPFLPPPLIASKEVIPCPSLKHDTPSTSPEHETVSAFDNMVMNPGSENAEQTTHVSVSCQTEEVQSTLQPSLISQNPENLTTPSPQTIDCFVALESQVDVHSVSPCTEHLHAEASHELQQRSSRIEASEESVTTAFQSSPEQHSPLLSERSVLQSNHHEVCSAEGSHFADVSFVTQQQTTADSAEMPTPRWEVPAIVDVGFMNCSSGPSFPSACVVAGSGARAVRAAAAALAMEPVSFASDSSSSLSPRQVRVQNVQKMRQENYSNDDRAAAFFDHCRDIWRTEGQRPRICRQAQDVLTGLAPPSTSQPHLYSEATLSNTQALSRGSSMRLLSAQRATKDLTMVRPKTAPMSATFGIGQAPGKPRAQSAARLAGREGSPPQHVRVNLSRSMREASPLAASCPLCPTCGQVPPSQAQSPMRASRAQSPTRASRQVSPPRAPSPPRPSHTAVRESSPPPFVPSMNCQKLEARLIAAYTAPIPGLLPKKVLRKAASEGRLRRQVRRPNWQS